ncbi:MAG TPA: thioredoxin family protein [Pelobium sp.]
MKLKKAVVIVLWLGGFLSGHPSFAQKKNVKINWISFSALNDSLKANPKPVFVIFYADWCSLCKQMERSTFEDKRIVELLNRNYYAVKMNVETKDTIIFGNQTFINKRIKKVNPIHDIALLMASRKNRPFSLPAIVLLDDKFIAKARYFQFLDAEAMDKILLEMIRCSTISLK